LILKSEDTVFLKRAGSMEKYNLVKEMLSKIDVTNFEQIVHFNNYAIKENLSFGGAADLLVTTLLLHKVKKDFF
jgi:triphosphoribosyl-dephospho-CoA synthetase